MLRGVGILLVAVLALFTDVAAMAQLTFVDDGTRISVLDKSIPLLTYRYGSEASDNGPPDSHFIFPLTGLSGEVFLAESGASDGHSGIFWAWGNCRVDGRPLDVWAGTSAQRVFERWTLRSEGPERADLGLQNVWILDESGEAQVLESVHFTVWARTQNSRSVDVSIYLRNITHKLVEIRGVDDVQGFCVRMAPDLINLTLSGGQGVVEEGVSSIMSPWIDLSYRNARHSSYSGLTIFQHPENPGFSGRNWFFEPGGLVGAGIPSSERYELKPGEGLHFRYRLYIHDGYGPDQGLEQIYGAYLSDVREENAG